MQKNTVGDVEAIHKEITKEEELNPEWPQLWGTREKIRRPKTIRVKTFIFLVVAAFIVIGAAFGALYYRAHHDMNGNLPVTITTPPKFLFSIFEGKNKFSRPMAAAVDKNGMIYITNNGMNTVEIIQPNGKAKMSFGSTGTGPGQLLYPYGIGILPDGNILVAETGNGRVQEFTPEGKYVKIFISRADKLGLEKPGPLYIDSKGKVYIGDLSQNRVYVLDQNAELIKTFDNLQYPHGLTVDETSRKIFVSNAGKVEIDILSLAQSDSAPLSSIMFWKPNTRFSMVRGIAADAYGRLYVNDTISSSVRVFDKNGAYLFSFGNQGLEDGQFVYPVGITVDGLNKIYVTDWGNNRVQVWGY